MPSVSPYFFQLPNGKISYYKSGSGEKILIAFHGYGNTASMFFPLSEFIGNQYTIYGINLPHHGHSNWDELADFTIEDVRTLLVHFLKEKITKRASLIGYSMGGRICLSVVEEMPEFIDQCILIASDGLVFNPFYFFATHTIIGKQLLKRFVEHPNNYLRFFKWLRNRKWIDAARFKFVMNYIGSKAERQFLFRVWPAMRQFIPDRKKIAPILIKSQIKLFIFSGTYDRVIPPNHAIKFKKQVQSCILISLEKGHRIFDTETWEKIASIL